VTVIMDKVLVQLCIIYSRICVALLLSGDCSCVYFVFPSLSTGHAGVQIGKLSRCINILCGCLHFFQQNIPFKQ
jgi:hypothetical protein